MTWLMRSRSSLLESSTRALVWFALSRAACARCRASSAFPLASATWAGAETLIRGTRCHPTCFYPCPCDTHPVGELGHLAGRVPQLLLGMPRSVQGAVSLGDSSTTAQPPAAPCPILIPAPGSPAGALGAGHVACGTAHLQEEAGR